jgi:hypothetical protein
MIKRSLVLLAVLAALALAFSPQPLEAAEVQATLTAENTYTDAVPINGNARNPGWFAVEVTGTWTGLITIQWSRDRVTWTDFQATDEHPIDANIILVGAEVAGTRHWRAGFKAGDYGDGAATVAIRQR